MKKVLAVVAALMASGPVHAAIVTDTFAINASNFSPAGAPYSSIVGTFSVTFDNAASVAPTQNGFTVSDFTLSGYDTHFVYSKSRDWLTFGTNLLSTGGCGAASGSNQYCFIISNASTTFTPYNMLAYSAAGASNAYSSTFTVTRVTQPAVPEPATWAMMIGGFGMVGGAMRRRRTAITFA